MRTLPLRQPCAGSLNSRDRLAFHGRHHPRRPGIRLKAFDFARHGDAALLEYIKQGVNADMVNQDGQSFVMLAAYNGHAELVRELAYLGADVNLLNDRNQSPLAGAIFKKEDAVVDALLTLALTRRLAPRMPWTPPACLGAKT